MTTIHWLIISIGLLNVGYYLGRWVGRSQGRRENIREWIEKNSIRTLSQQVDKE
ncbi:hypothetical protein GF312_08480 [Candidatus Poribacteria bacterium]|nr:hypothetical protein [Candidatus Poribacteria bacterium]